MTMNEIEILKRIDERLKWILALQVRNGFDEGLSKKEMVEELHPFGFTNAEIAEIINSSEGSVRKYKSMLKDEGRLND